MSKKLLFYLAIIFLLYSCKGSKGKDVDQKNAIYFWKTDWDFSTYSMKQLDSLDVKVFYLHFFDVDWDEETKSPMPVGDAYSGMHNENPFVNHEVIPTVFITNKVFQNLNEKDIPQLVNNIHRKIIAKFKSFVFELPQDTAFINLDYEDPYRLSNTRSDFAVVTDSTMKACYKAVKEIQFDCDWTESTKDKYFKFLTLMKQKLDGRKISATIRLYPFKYPEKAGIPPVDKGMLMCYNVGDVTKVEEGNSIFDKKEIMKYLKSNKEYPLPLDYAFPIFEWASIYKGQKLAKLMHKDDMAYYLSDTTEYSLIEKGPGFIKYKCKVGRELYNSGFKIETGDIVKLEHIDYDAVSSVAAKISSMNKNQTPNISLFYYDPQTIIQHHEEIENIYSKF